MLAHFNYFIVIISIILNKNITESFIIVIFDEKFT